MAAKTPSTFASAKQWVSEAKTGLEGKFAGRIKRAAEDIALSTSQRAPLEKEAKRLSDQIAALQGQLTALTTQIDQLSRSEEKLAVDREALAAQAERGNPWAKAQLRELDLLTNLLAAGESKFAGAEVYCRLPDDRADTAGVCSPTRLARMIKIAAEADMEPPANEMTGFNLPPRTLGDMYPLAPSLMVSQNMDVLRVYLSPERKVLGFVISGMTPTGPVTALQQLPASVVATLPVLPAEAQKAVAAHAPVELATPAGLTAGGAAVAPAATAGPILEAIHEAAATPVTAGAAAAAAPKPGFYW